MLPRQGNLQFSPAAETARISSAARLHQSAFVGCDHCLDPVPELELGQQVGDVCLHSSLADKQLSGEGTVKTHVSHLLTKLQLRDRVQAVVAAYESGLVQAGGG